MGAVITVWVDEWQSACCGTPFAVGGAVDWTVRTDVDRAFTAAATSAAVAASIEYAEEHHDASEEPLVRVVATVHRIRAVVRSADDGIGRLVDVAASTERPVRAVREDLPGWVVELRTT